MILSCIYKNSKPAWTAVINGQGCEAEGLKQGKAWGHSSEEWNKLLLIQGISCVSH